MLCCVVWFNAVLKEKKVSARRSAHPLQTAVLLVLVSPVLAPVIGTRLSAFLHKTCVKQMFKSSINTMYALFSLELNIIFILNLNSVVYNRDAHYNR